MHMIDQYSNTIIEAVEKVKMSVVKIERVSVENRKERQNGSGSGFIFSSDGFLLTNSHVLNKAQKIYVVLHDGSRHLAELIGEDPSTDLAILKISAFDFSIA